MEQFNDNLPKSAQIMEELQTAKIKHFEIMKTNSYLTCFINCFRLGAILRKEVKEIMTVYLCWRLAFVCECVRILETPLSECCLQIQII